MVNVLFNPQGRIKSGPFWTGIIIIIAISLALNAASTFGPPNLAMIFGVVSIALIYPMVCVYGKRFHDAGMSAWMFLVVLLAAIVLSVVGAMVILPIIAGPPPVPSSSDFAEIMKEAQAHQKKVFLPTTAISLAVWLLVALPVSLLKSQPEANKHGPPPA